MVDLSCGSGDCVLSGFDVMCCFVPDWRRWGL